MAEEDFGAGQMEETEKVGGIALPAGDEAAGVVEPGKEALNFPAAFGAPHRAAILGTAPAAAIAGDHLDAVVATELGIERIAVVAFVADQPRRERADEAGLEGSGDEVRLSWRSAGHVHGERKTMAVADCHDLAAFSATSWANGSAPFLAPAKVASTNASVRSSLPRSRKSSARRCKSRSRRPERCHC